MPRPLLHHTTTVCWLACVWLAPGLAMAEEPAAAEPKPAPVAVAKDPVLSPFGIGSCAQHSRTHPKWMPQMTAIGIRDIRSFATGRGVEPVQGTFDFTLVDEQLSYFDSIGVTPGALLNGLPKWNTKDAKGGLPLNSLPEWSAYVTELVKHTKGRVTHFEVWNEAPNFTNNAPPADYAKVVIASYVAAKAANPDAKIGIAVKSAHINYLYQAIRAGAKGHFDYVTLHPYELLGTTNRFPGNEPMFMAIAPTVRKMLADQDPTKADCPIWFTEIGTDASKHGEGNQAQALLKAYTLGIAQGIACINWFEGMDGDSGPMGLLDAKGVPRSAYTAMAQLIKHLGRHPKPLGWVLLNDKHYAWFFDGASGVVMATWVGTLEEDTYAFGKTVQIVDPLTGTVAAADACTLTMAPVLVYDLPEALVAQAKANQSRVLPWGGDYSAAKEVSVTFDDKKNVEKGLHTRSAESIAADVVAYGGAARAGSVPGGIAFMVDRNFLSYTTVPIEITAVVRKNEKAKSVKLTLEYESTSGYQKAAAFEIPDSKDWVTKTWKIDDCQFVGTWCFNFRFNQGNYFIKSMAVTRLDR